jgi:hypothetical protein
MSVWQQGLMLILTQHIRTNHPVAFPGGVAQPCVDSSSPQDAPRIFPACC